MLNKTSKTVVSPTFSDDVSNAPADFSPLLLGNAKLLGSAEEADEEVRIAWVHAGSRALKQQTWEFISRTYGFDQKEGFGFTIFTLIYTLNGSQGP